MDNYEEVFWKAHNRNFGVVGILGDWNLSNSNFSEERFFDNWTANFVLGLDYKYAEVVQPIEQKRCV